MHSLEGWPRTLRLPAKLADTAGLEPATSELTAPRTTIVLHVKIWCSYEDLNPEPFAYKATALPLELYEQLMQMADLMMRDRE